MAEQIQLVVGTENIFGLSCIVLKQNLDGSKHAYFPLELGPKLRRTIEAEQKWLSGSDHSVWWH